MGKFIDILILMSLSPFVATFMHGAVIIIAKFLLFLIICCLRVRTVLPLIWLEGPWGVYYYSVFCLDFCCWCLSFFNGVHLFVLVIESCRFLTSQLCWWFANSTKNWWNLYVAPDWPMRWGKIATVLALRWTVFSMVFYLFLAFPCSNCPKLLSNFWYVI